MCLIAGASASEPEAATGGRPESDNATRLQHPCPLCQGLAPVLHAHADCSEAVRQCTKAQHGGSKRRTMTKSPQLHVTCMHTPSVQQTPVSCVHAGAMLIAQQSHETLKGMWSSRGALSAVCAHRCKGVVREGAQVLPTGSTEPAYQQRRLNFALCRLRRVSSSSSSRVQLCLASSQAHVGGTTAGPRVEQMNVVHGYSSQYLVHSSTMPECRDLPRVGQLLLLGAPLSQLHHALRIVCAGDCAAWAEGCQL